MGAFFTINTGGSLSMTGSLTFSNNSTVNIAAGSNLSIKGDLTNNNNNSAGITINGAFTVGGAYSWKWF